MSSQVELDAEVQALRQQVEDRPPTVAAMLREVAEWLDLFDRMSIELCGIETGGDDVQSDLRRLAEVLDRHRLTDAMWYGEAFEG